MTSSMIAHVLDPMLDKRQSKLDADYEKAFHSVTEDGRHRDHIRNQSRRPVQGLDWAGDKLLACLGKDRLALIDPTASSEERSWSGDFTGMQTSPTEHHIAAAVQFNGRFQIVDVRDNNKSKFDTDLKKVSPNMKEFLGLCWSPDGKHIALNNRSDQVYILDLRKTGTLLRGAETGSMQNEVNQMVWSVAGDTLWMALGGAPGKLHVFPAPSLSIENSATLVAHQWHAYSVAADVQGKYIASGGADCLVALWDPRHLTCVRTFGYATQTVSCLGFNKNTSVLAWGTGAPNMPGEKNLTFVGAETGALYFQESTAAPVVQLKWHSSRNVIAYAVNDKQLEDNRDSRMRNDRGDNAVLRTLKLPEVQV